MQRYYQGQLDFFCAVYAVINALTAIYGLTLAQARRLFASVLGDVSGHPRLWRMTLENRTDFHWLTEYILHACHSGAQYPVRVFRPFLEERTIPPGAADLASAEPYSDNSSLTAPPGQVWSALEDWLPELRTQPRAGTARRAVILRFHRYVRYMKDPIISHWTTADHHGSGLIHLRDASKEDHALVRLDRGATAFSPDDVSEDRPVRVEPGSLYFLERR